MKNKVVLILNMVFAFSIVGVSSAEQWQIVGPRALGMGGAHVAVASDATASYWNPAAYGFFGRDKETTGAQVQEDSVEDVYNVLEYDYDDLADKGKAGDMTQSDTAVASDATAPYLDPAAYGFSGQEKEAIGQEEETKDEHSDRVWGVHAHFGAGAQVQEDLVEDVDDILKYDYDDLADKGKTGTMTLSDMDDYIQMIAEVKDLEGENVGVTVMADAGLNVRYKNFGIGVYSLMELAATDAIVDMNNLGIQGASDTDAIDKLVSLGGSGGNAFTSAQRTSLIDRIASLPEWSTADATIYVDSVNSALTDGGLAGGSATDEMVEATYDVAVVANDLEAGAGGGSLEDNNSSILFKGANVIEVPLTYGYAFNDNFSVGGNLKFMRARVYYTRIRVFDQDEDDFLGDALEEYEESDNFGIDLGVLFKYKQFRVGLVGRNINKPKFDYAGSGDYEIDPQVRAGIACFPTDWIILSVDADITKNDTPLSNQDSRGLSGGIEVKIWNILSLRGGAYGNLEESDVVYTAGLGLDILGFNMDFGAAMSDSSSELDGYTVPDETRFEFAASLQY